MIWKDSKEVGFGFKKVNEGKCYFIAIYYPAGNIFNKYNDNIKEKEYFNYKLKFLN